MSKANNNPSSKNQLNSDQLIAALSYFWILFLIPLLVKRDSEFAQFHAKQGLVLFVIELAVSMVNIIPILGQIIWFFASICFVIIAIIAIIKTLNGEKWEIPVVYDLSKKVNL